MSKNTKHKDYKRLLALREKEDELDEAIKKIKKEDLDTYLNEGWVKGRK